MCWSCNECERMRTMRVTDCQQQQQQHHEPGKKKGKKENKKQTHNTHTFRCVWFLSYGNFFSFFLSFSFLLFIIWWIQNLFPSPFSLSLSLCSPPFLHVGTDNVYIHRPWSLRQSLFREDRAELCAAAVILRFYLDMRYACARRASERMKNSQWGP